MRRLKQIIGFRVFVTFPSSFAEEITGTVASAPRTAPHGLFNALLSIKNAQKTIHSFAAYVHGTGVSRLAASDNMGLLIVLKKINENKLLLENFIISDNFYITNLDILILANKFNIPLVLYSSTKLKENNNKFLTLQQYTPETIPSQMYFIKTPVFKNNNMAKYRLLKDKKHFYVNSEDIKAEMTSIISNSFMSFDTYISSFVKPKRAKKKIVIANNMTAQVKSRNNSPNNSPNNN